MCAVLCCCAGRYLVAAVVLLILQQLSILIILITRMAPATTPAAAQGGSTHTCVHDTARSRLQQHRNVQQWGISRLTCSALEHTPALHTAGGFGRLAQDEPCMWVAAAGCLGCLCVLVLLEQKQRNALQCCNSNTQMCPLLSSASPFFALGLLLLQGASGCKVLEDLCLAQEELQPV